MTKARPLLSVGSVLSLAVLAIAGCGASESERKLECSNNLKRIGVALSYYHDVWKTFPPAFIPDEGGKPMHSWRVLILPFLRPESEQPANRQDNFQLFEQYSFDEPWDGPNNSLLAEKMPVEYRCPSSPNHDQTVDYMMVVGKGLLSDGPGQTKQWDVKDGKGNTIAIVEVADSDINWMEPRDLDFHDLVLQINGDKQRSISSSHPGGAHVLLLNGGSLFLSDATETETIKNMLTIAGREEVEAK